MGADEPRLVAVTTLPGSDGGLATAAAIGVALARCGATEPEGVVLVDPDSGVRRRPTLVSSSAARSLESELRDVVPASARGTLCVVSVPAAELCETLEACRESRASAVVVHAEPERWRELVDEGGVDAVVLRADASNERSLLAIAARELIAGGMPTGVIPRQPGLVQARRALAGIEPGGELGGRSARLARRLLRAKAPPQLASWRVEAGQAIPVTLFLALATVVAGVLLAVVGAAATGASRYQRAADLAAVSAARSMRDDHHRLFLAPVLPNGAPNPAHLSEAEYRARAMDAATEALARNEADEAAVSLTYPGAAFAPTRVRVTLEATPEIDGERQVPDVEVSAVAEAYPASSPDEAATPAVASGGGYSGPLAERQGEGMRPDVAQAFDAMAEAASREGHGLLINSAFRSDAEQAALFAANPDPRMVARPGTSLHRCGTELDLGPSSAYGWLAQNAQRFGF
ncbi:MAG: M15 family metallopeptidase, partial [Actinomycetota bacterium]|nr:M15 family metallopeptidase [Actinomycetota bacterium]